MKSKDIKELSNKEIEMKIAEARQELLNLRFAHATGSLKNPKQITLLKKDIARMLTVLKQRQMDSVGE
jgi:large subunit ribosomal protein L29